MIQHVLVVGLKLHLLFQCWSFRWSLTLILFCTSPLSLAQSPFKELGKLYFPKGAWMTMMNYLNCVNASPVTLARQGIGSKSQSPNSTQFNLASRLGLGHNGIKILSAD